MEEFFITIVALYFVPAICAFLRDSKSKFPILVLNILFGWTGLGWLVCFIWTFASPQNPVSKKIISKTIRKKTIDQLSIVLCTKCGSEISNTSKFCESCGIAISDTKPKIISCTKCGSEVSNTSKFCKSCGITIGDTKLEHIVTTDSKKKSTALPLSTRFFKWLRNNWLLSLFITLIGVIIIVSQI